MRPPYPRRDFRPSWPHPPWLFPLEKPSRPAGGWSCPGHRPPSPLGQPSPAVPVPVLPPGALSPPLFLSRCPFPRRASAPPAVPVQRPAQPPSLLSTAVWSHSPHPTAGPQLPRLFSPAPLPPCGCSGPGALRPAAAARPGPGAARARREGAQRGTAASLCRFPRPRRRSPSRASKIVCAILEPPPPREPKWGYASIVGAVAAAAVGSGPPEGAREPPPGQGAPSRGNLAMAHGTTSIPGLLQLRLDDPVTSACPPSFEPPTLHTDPSPPRSRTPVLSRPPSPATSDLTPQL